MTGRSLMLAKQLLIFPIQLPYCQRRMILFIFGLSCSYFIVTLISLF